MFTEDKHENNHEIHEETVNEFNSACPNHGQRGKIKLNFYFHTSLWCLKSFYEVLKGLHKTFWGTRKKCENKNLTLFLSQFNFQKLGDGKA